MVFLPADKGQYTAVLDRTVYHQKVMLLLEDNADSKKLKDTTPAAERKLTSVFLAFEKEGQLSDH